jgi:hypothetical protein
MPVLTITPDMTAETWLGAAGWASGSHTCSGMNPALVPNPTTASTNSRPAVWVVGDGPARIVAKSSDPLGRPRSRNIPNRNALPR